MRELTATIAGGSLEHVVLDMEAGVEHLSRGTARNTDTLLVIAEPYYKALETAARVAVLGKELGIARVITIVNKVRASDEDSINQFAARHARQVAASIPHDESVAEADRRGIAPIDHDDSSLLIRAVETLATQILRG